MTPTLRPIRDQLRHELFESLNIIEDIVAGARPYRRRGGDLGRR